MWIHIARFILRNKILLLSLIAAITVFMGYQAQFVEMSYEYAPLLPEKDPAYKENQEFRKLFGEEGNVIVVGLQSDEFFELKKFNNWTKLCKELKEIDGVENLLSVSNTYYLKKNKELKKFEVAQIFPEKIDNQQQLDSLAKVFHNQPIYKGFLYNDKTNAYGLIITVNKDKMKSKKREQLVDKIEKTCLVFADANNVKLHFSGLPYIRVVTSVKIKNELLMFVMLAMGICILILFLFFRSFKAMLFPSLVVLIGVIWSVGIMSLLGYKITLLTGMVPPLLIVIGIPNSIFLLNKYHNEYVNHGNKTKALQRVITKVGNAIFLTNLTTASGFATFTITSSAILKEFGIVTSLNIMGLFVLSLLLIPIFFSFFAPPKPRHVRHLENKTIGKVIDILQRVTTVHRKKVYAIAVAILLVSGYGISRMDNSGYMVDDIPESSPIYKDLKFFEHHMGGLMPLEIMIDTKKPNGVLNLTTLRKLDQLEKKFTKYEELAAPLSLSKLAKVARQAYYNGSPRHYKLPSSMEKNIILSYATKGEGQANMLHAYLDSTRSITRMSVFMKDIGTDRMDSIYHKLNADIQEVFPPERYKTTVTGSSVIFFKGTQYLMENLFMSLALAVVLISLFMSAMFYSWRMVVMSLVPNILPLLFTAAIMGYFGIPIKASTILVFSVAFGISVDNTIHFLAKYRQELSAFNWDIGKSVQMALKETGVSMMYTSTVLFFGFGIFSVSSFGGTVAMGVLVSLTLLVAMMSNLILLPSLLLGLERIITNKSFKEPLLDIYNEEEDIELDHLEIVSDNNK
ncbi:RND family transporter [Prolixibacteraceae bacterium JC049]|nr:RND family transporter [Prolixibacteraceae bacterium JC049]